MKRLNHIRPKCSEKLEGGYCGCFDWSHTEIPMPKVKEPKMSLGGFEISVDTKDLDKSLEKARELLGVLQKIDGLTGRITRDIDKINRYALGKQI